MYKIMISLLSAFALVGCATTANYQHMVNHWQGAQSRDLIAAWGSPDATVKLPTGNTVYMYTHQQLSSAPVGATPVAAPVFNSTGVPITPPGFNDVFNRRTPAMNLFLPDLV